MSLIPSRKWADSAVLRVKWIKFQTWMEPERRRSCMSPCGDQLADSCFRFSGAWCLTRHLLCMWKRSKVKTNRHKHFGTKFNRWTDLPAMRMTNPRTSTPQMMPTMSRIFSTWQWMINASFGRNLLAGSSSSDCRMNWLPP
jgi:hypothetical protein